MTRIEYLLDRCRRSMNPQPGYAMGGTKHSVSGIEEEGPEIALTGKGTAYLKLPRNTFLWPQEKRFSAEDVIVYDHKGVMKVSVGDCVYRDFKPAFERLNEIFSTGGVAIIIRQSKL